MLKRTFGSFSLVLIFTVAAAPSQALSEDTPSACGSELSSPPPDAEKHCGKELAPLCRSQHSMRRLKDGKILMVAGQFRGPRYACDTLIFDSAKEKISNREPIRAGIEFPAAIGFKLDDKTYAFTRRLQSDNSIGSGYEKNDVMLFWDVDEKKITGEMRFLALTTVSTQALLRTKEDQVIVHFHGHEAQVAYDAVEDTPLQQRYQIDAWKVSPYPGQTDAVFSPSGEMLGTLRRARIQFDTATFSDGRMFIAGGQEQGRDGQLSIAETGEFYLPGKGWFETAPLPKPAQSIRVFSLNEDEVLVVELAEGEGWTWSFKAKEWKKAFKIGAEVSRGVMHSTGSFVAIAKGSGKITDLVTRSGERLFVWNPKDGKSETYASELSFEAGTGLVELADRRILEAQPNGLLIWDLKTKKQTRVKR